MRELKAATSYQGTDARCGVTQDHLGSQKRETDADQGREETADERQDGGVGGKVLAIAAEKGS